MNRKIDFSVMFFSGKEGNSVPDSYRLIRDIAEFADQNGFKRLWLPERHFVPFGALHPSPAVLAGYLASFTQHIRLAAGSVVAPLHKAQRIVEDWSVVDNLSAGRVDLSLASGWLKSDFQLATEPYEKRHEMLESQFYAVEKYWRGSQLNDENQHLSPGTKVYPTPFQQKLPLWITAARNIKTFELAGRLGCNVLTYLVDMGIERLEQAITVYREARAAAGFDPESGVVTLMLHTLLAENNVPPKDAIKEHYLTYLRENHQLLNQADRAKHILTDEVIEELLEVQFLRVYEKTSLMGAVEAADLLLNKIADIGVDEIACLIDFVDDNKLIMDTLTKLGNLKMTWE